MLRMTSSAARFPTMSDPEPPASTPLVPSAVRHFYASPEANQPIGLYEGLITASHQGRKVAARGSVQLNWAPLPHIEYTIGFDDLAVSAAFNPDPPDEPVVSVEAAEVPTAPTGPLSDYSEHLMTLTSWLDNTEIQAHSGASLSSVTFCVANLPIVIPGTFLAEGNHRWAGRVVLDGGPWTVTLDAREGHIERQSNLQLKSGYCVTHTSRLARADGSAFTVSEAKGALKALHFTLSFASGRWISPLLPVGFSQQGEAVWTCWEHPTVDPWRAANTVADPMTPRHLPDLFSCLESIWNDPFRQEVVTRSIHYFIRANDPTPVDLAVSTAQAGLELLSWTTLVAEGGMLNKTYGRHPRTAALNLRDLLQGRGIPTSIPTALTSLQGAARAQGCSDGPEILTRMRNGVIHPTRDKPTFSSPEWIDAWRLAEHYLMLSILSYLGYSGTHRDVIERRHAGDVVTVPWASQGAQS